MRIVIALCALVSLAACADGEWRAREWNDMENMCRSSPNCSATCQNGQSEARSGCVEAQ